MENGFPKGDAAAAFDKYVEAYVANHFNVEKYGSGLDVFLLNLPPTPINLLDIACGPGNLVHYILSKRPDAKMTGIDLSPKMVEAAMIHNPTATFHVMDIREMNQLEGTFDGITIGFGLPYLSEAEGIKLLKETAAKLASEGLLFLSVTLGNHEAKLEYSSKGEGIWQFLWGEIEVKLELSKHFDALFSEVLCFQYGERPPVQEWIGVYQRKKFR